MVRLPKGSKKIDGGNGVDLYEVPPDPRKKYPLWKIDALQGDIDRAKEQIAQFNLHIDDLNKTIKEREEQIALCQERDRAIAEWERNRGDSDIPPSD